MRKVFSLAAACLSLAACSTYYNPTPEQRIHIVDSPADVRACRRLGEVSGGVLPTSPGFVHHIDAMLTATVALGGTDLLLDRRTPDWLVTGGIAYDCNRVRGPARERVVVRAAG